MQLFRMKESVWILIMPTIRFSTMLVVVTVILAGIGGVTTLEHSLFRDTLPISTGGTLPAQIFQRETERIRSMFEVKGSVAAVADFKARFRGYSQETIHEVEHVLGEELYRREGVGGLALCPDSLLFGCYHGFFAEAFFAEGKSFISRAEQICGRWDDFFKASGCIHGIGHGLLSFEGHANLLLALEDCDSFSYSIAFGNTMCHTGVFMEYNTTSVHGVVSQGEPLRIFDPQHPYDPCDRVPRVYQSPCYLQLPQWWNEFMPNGFLKMGELCDAVQDFKNEESCFRSIGMVVTRATQQDKDRIAMVCTQMPTSQEAHFCIEEAAKLLLILREPYALELCSFLAASEKDICIKNVESFMCDKMHVCNEKNSTGQVEFQPETFDFREDFRHWSQRIAEVGASAAYQEFKTIYLKKDLKTQHIAAHVFGGLLYDKEGLEGVTVCDKAFAFGCYHIFLTRALSEIGLEAVTELNKICLEKFGVFGAGCQHGIGHGLVEYLGYSKDKLTAALHLCPPSVSKSPLVGCASGVFMEYYSRVAFGPHYAALEWRSFDPHNPYEPCPTVPEQFRGTCYSQLGLWWDRVLHGDYKKIGELCNGIAEEKNRKLCFVSVGVFAATLSEYDVSETITKCRKMPDMQSEFLCRAGGSISFGSSLNRQSFAPEVCAGLEKEAEERCSSMRVDLLEGEE